MRDSCENCGESFLGKEMSKEDKEIYGTSHYRLEIGIDGGYMGIYDGLVAKMCPKCSRTFPVSNHKVHLEMYKKYINYVQK